ncbi:hypothetical protein ABNQ39_36875 (plasmid) [Azospirillum sp. A26]|uniref:hypothetical protein n=1 Tax=Azospirillum sp. A26 TaxID=3160607 RepID=UPI00366C106B
MLRAGRLLPCINIGADGGIGTAIIDPPANLPKIDYAREVCVVVRGGDADSLFVLEWTDLIDGTFQVIENYVSGRPIELEAWSADGSAPATGVIDTAWKDGKVNLGDRFLNQPGTTGIRFLQLTLSPSMPTEIAFLINAETSHGRAIGSLKRLRCDPTCGVVRVDGAVIAFVLIQLADGGNGSVVDEFLLAFDPFSEAARDGLDSLARQSHIHLIIADLDGEVLGFQEYANTFAFDQFAGELRKLEGSAISVS